jgi:hypothetical protein
VTDLAALAFGVARAAALALDVARAAIDDCDRWSMFLTASRNKGTLYFLDLAACKTLASSKTLDTYR